MENQEHILGSSLESINGISIEEIVERLGSYVSQECTEGAIALLSAMLRYEYPLKIIGILENEDTNAEFCFVTENGERITLVLELMDTIPEDMNVVSLKTEWFLRETNIDKNYWYTYLEENNMLYVRVNRFYEDANAPALEFQQQLMEEIKDAPENTRLVMDFRNNSGGYLYLFDFEKIVQEVNQREDIKTFLLINEKSYSAASAVPWAFHNKINNAKLVGAPAGQAPTNFGNPKEYKMPNSKNIVVIARAYWEITTDYAYETLIPDITIYQTLEDYKQGIDTVLEAVKEMK